MGFGEKSGRGRGREGRDGFVERRAEEEEEGSVAVESEVRVRATERRREKNYHNIYASAIVTVHTILHPLM